MREKRGTKQAISWDTAGGLSVGHRTVVCVAEYG